jgi:hypothetical protein
MLDPYTFEEVVRLERRILADQLARQSTWVDHLPRRSRISAMVDLRRRLARALLMLADRLDPRAVVSAPHLPARPTLNGTLHHA